MKKTLFTLILAAATLTGCTSTKLASVSEEVRGEISWNAFCDAHGYDRNDYTFSTVNEYLGSWCGSEAEEEALINAGVKPY